MPPLPLLDFTQHNSITVDESVLDSIPRNIHLDFLMEYMSINNRFLEV